jgi:hypothetical protein
VSALAPRHPLCNTTILRGETPVQQIAAAGAAGFEQSACWHQDVEVYDGSVASLGQWRKEQGGGGT